MDKLTKKIIIGILTFAFLGGLTFFVNLVISSNKNSHQKDIEDNTAQKITLELLIDNTQSLEGLNAMTKEIEEKYNIATKFDLRPSGTEGDNILRTRLAIGDAGDLCAYNSGALLQTLNPETNFVDLSKEPFVANVDDTFKTCVTVDKKIFGIPYGSYMGGVWLYNKKVYKDLNLSIPKTWEDLMNNCKLIKKSGKVAVIGSYKDSWTAQMIVLTDFYNINTESPSFARDFALNKATFTNTPAALRSFEKLQEIYDSAYLNDDFLSSDYNDAIGMLAEGKGAHYPMLTNGLGAIETNYPDKINDIGAFVQPSDKASINGLTVWAGGSIYIYSRSQNIEAAKKWASFVASRQGVEAYGTKIKPEGPYCIKDTKLPENSYQAVKEILPYFESKSISLAQEYISPVKGPSLAQICVEVGSGIKSAAEGAKTYDNDVEKQAKQLMLPGW